MPHELWDKSIQPSIAYTCCPMSELQIMFPLHLLKFLVHSRWPSRTSQQKGHKMTHDRYRHVTDMLSCVLSRCTRPRFPFKWGAFNNPACRRPPTPTENVHCGARPKENGKCVLCFWPGKNHLYRAESEKSTCLLMWSLRDPLTQGNWRRLQYKDVPGMNQLKSLLHPAKH